MSHGPIDAQMHGFKQLKSWVSDSFIGYFFEFSRQIHILLGYFIVGIVGGESYFHSTIDVKQLRVVVGFFAGEGHFGDKAHRLCEISEPVFSAEFVLGEGPARQLGQALVDLNVG